MLDESGATRKREWRMMEGVEGGGGFGAAVGEVAHEGVDGAAEVVVGIESVDNVLREVKAAYLAARAFDYE